MVYALHSQPFFFPFLSLLQRRAAEAVRGTAHRRRGAGAGAEGVPQGQPGVQDGGTALCRGRAPEQPGGPLQRGGRDPFPPHQEGRTVVRNARRLLHSLLTRTFFPKNVCAYAGLFFFCLLKSRNGGQ